MTILVTGATGNIGREVVAGLLEAGEHVRALTRNPSAARLPSAVDVMEGDLAQPSTLAPALVGVDRLYLFCVPDTAQQVVDIVRETGVRRIVVLSSAAVTDGTDTAYHLPVELAVEASGLEWTHVRAGELATNRVELWGPSIRAERVVRDPFPEAPSIPTHERDVADVALAALLTDEHIGAAYDVFGPEVVTNREQVRAIAAAIGEDVRYEQVTPEQARALYLAQGGWAAANADYLLGFVDYSGDARLGEGWEDDTDWAGGPMPTVELVTGQTPRTFAQWAHDHARDFWSSG